MSRHSIVVLALVLVGSVAAASADVQGRRGRLVVSVVDQSGLVVPNAEVTLISQDGDEQARNPAASTTNGEGVAVIGNLPDGHYTIRVEFPGFDPGVVRDLRVRGGDVLLKVTLQIQKVEQEVTVSRDRQSSALDPRGSAFSSVLTRDQIDALPDDPDEMEAALKAMAPPGAVIRVDGFTGGKLPPKSAIRSIRLPKMDMFAAQNHGGMNGMTFIDIMTVPGAGALRGGVDLHLVDDALNARNPFTPTRSDEQFRQGGFNLSGTLKANRTSFSINGDVSSQFASPNLLAVLPDGTTTRDVLRQPRDGANVTARLDHAINRDHALRLSVDHGTSSAHNLGVGGYNLFDRAFDTTSRTSTLRLSENGPIGRRWFTESRLQVKWTHSDSRSVVELPTLRVQDAFTSGGAQQRGGQHGLELEMATDLDYVRGAHSWRTGLLVEGGRFRSDDMSNYLGTYTFASLADYQAGRPAAYARRVGDPNISYSSLQAAVYLQDDWRIARSVLLSPGVRYGLQGHVSDWWNVSPRMSAAWSPFRNGSTTIRASYGYFYDWVTTDLYKQTLLIDGFRQRELNVPFPSYPDPGDSLTAPPTNRYLWSDGLTLPGAHRMSAGVERTITKNGRLNVTYSRGWGRGLVRGLNLNVPVGGVRPDQAFANTVELVTDASSRSQSMNVAYNLVRMDMHRMFLLVNYNWSRNATNTAGGFSLPASGDALDVEWGPANGTVPHRLGVSFAMSPLRNVAIGLNARAQSGLPYNITTGRDDNADGVFNDRPAGVSRNSARGAAQCDVGGRISYAIGFGTPKPATGGPGGMRVVINGGGGGLAPGFGGGAEDKRYRVEFYVSGQNLLNRANYTAYSFVTASPFFGQAIAASQPRKLQVGVRFGF